MGKQLRPGYSAWVNTDETAGVLTPFGLIPQPVQVFVEGGGELPDNLADGEEERLDALEAFTPLPPFAQRVAAQGARLVADAPPEGEESVKVGITPPDVDDELPPPLPPGSVGADGRVSADLAHATAPETSPPSEFDLATAHATDIVDWIGVDSVRAQQAADAEAARDKPRKTVLEASAAVLGQELSE